MQESSVSIPLPPIEDFEAKVIEAAARQLLTSRSYDEDGDEVRYRSDLGRKIEDAMVATIKEQAREAAPDVAREILANGVIARVDRWGDVTGGTPMSLTAVVGEELLRELKDYNSRSGSSVLRKVINEEIEKKLRGEMLEALNAAKLEVLAALREESTKVLEVALSKSLGRLS